MKIMKVKYYVEIGKIRKKEINYESILCHNEELQELHNRARKKYNEWIYLSCNDYSNVEYLTFSCSANSVKGIKLGRDSLELYINELRRDQYNEEF